MDNLLAQAAPCSRRTLLAATLAAATLDPRRAIASAQASATQPGAATRTRFAPNVEMWWPKLPFLERVAAAADLGFPAVEFWTWKDKDIEALAALCRARKIAVAQFTGWGFSPGLNDPANHAAFRTAIEAACRVAHELGTQALTVVAGNDRAGVSVPEMHRIVVAGLASAAPIAEREGVTLLLEPMNGRVDHPGHCLYGSESAVKIVRAVGSSHVRVLFDLYHNQLAEGDLCGHLRDGRDVLGYVQVADHPGRHEPGTGEIHYPRVLSEVWDLGYRGFVGLECSPLAPEIEAARAVARADGG